MKRTVVFRDADKRRVSVTFDRVTKMGPSKDWDTLEDLSDYKVLSMTGTMSGSCGQIYGTIKPATENQKNLIAMWRKYHLNDASAGTKAQTEFLKSDGFKEVVRLFNGLIIDSDEWKRAVEKFNKTHYSTKYTVRVNRGRGYEVIMAIDKDGRVRGAASFIDHVTADDKKYAQEQFDAYIEKEMKALFAKELPLCVNEFFRKYSDISVNHIATVIQEDALTELCKKWYSERTFTLYESIPSDYEFRCLALKLFNLYMDRGYKYGTSWLSRTLPEDIDDQINGLCDAIESDNSDSVMHIAGEAKSVDGVDWSKDLSELDECEDNVYIDAVASEGDMDRSDAIIGIAIGKALNESAASVLENFSGTGSELCMYSFGGDDYYVGNVDDITDKAREVMENGYKDIWAETVSTGNTELGFKDWIDYVLENDGPTSILDRYDGDGLTAKVNGQKFYICRP